MPGKTTVEQYPLEARKVQKRFLNSMLAWLVIFVVLFVATMFLNSQPEACTAGQLRL
ncbi:MAG: hypothetical protein V1708_05350 [Candidatus Micrarchaeota archaeon]